MTDADRAALRERITQALDSIKHYPRYWPVAYDAERALLIDVHEHGEESPWMGGTKAAAEFIAATPQLLREVLSLLDAPAGTTDSRGCVLPTYVSVVALDGGGVQLEGHTSEQDWELELDAKGNAEGWAFEHVNTSREVDAPAASRPDGWQPIATAPKEDGVLVLLYPSRCWAEDVNSDCEVGYWDAHDGKWKAATSTWAEDYKGPTHWQPLPAPPAGTETEL